MNIPVDELMQQALRHKTLGQPAQAQSCLDQVLADDPENYAAWYEKSKLAIVQNDDVTLDGHVVSLTRYQSLVSADRRDYLQQCGFGTAQIDDIEVRLRQPALLAAQRLRFLHMAIQTAPHDAAQRYQAELDHLDAAARSERRHDVRVVAWTGLIGLVVAILAAVSVTWFWTASPQPAVLRPVVALIVAYALSVMGMVCYARARDRLNATALGLAINLVALIVTNLSVIALIIRAAT